MLLLYNCSTQEVIDIMVDMSSAIEEYLNEEGRILERLHKKGVLLDVDVQYHMDSARKKIEKCLSANRSYALLLMDLQHLSTRDSMDNVSLTDLAKRKNPGNPSYVIQSWLRDRNTIEFLRLWEKENNPEFKDEEANKLLQKLSESSFTLTAKVWISQTNAVGIISKQGSSGGTFAHRDIAIDFIVWLFPEKRYELVKMIRNRIFT